MNGKVEKKNEKVVKPKRKPIRNFFKSMVNVKRWVAADQIAASSKWIGQVAKNVFARKAPLHVETFKQAMRRLKLTEDDLKARAKQFLFMAGLYMLAAIVLIIYAFYLFITGHIVSGSIGLVLGILISVYAVREHFWYMQIKKRTLGCDLQDWMQFVLESIKPNGAGK